MNSIVAVLLFTTALINDTFDHLPDNDTALILGAFLFAIFSIGDKKQMITRVKRTVSYKISPSKGIGTVKNANQIEDYIDDVIQFQKDGKITRCEIERETVQTENGLEYGDELLITFVIKK